MIRAVAIAVLVALALGWVLLPRRIKPEHDDVQDLGDYGPLDVAYRIGRTSTFIH